MTVGMLWYVRRHTRDLHNLHAVLCAENGEMDTH